METTNSFTGGMNKDVSKSLYKEGNYIHAENFTLITDKGLSTGSLRNANGNLDFIKIPDLSNVVEISGLISGTVDINFTTVDTYSNSTTYLFTYSFISLENLGEQLKSQLALIGIGVAYTDTRIVLYSLLSNNENILQSIVVNSIVPVGPIAGTPIVNSNYVPSQIITPKIIGWEVVRDQIILFTAQSYSEAPVNQLGQIWKLVYDKYLENPVITLLYNGYLNFSVAHPIANPGATAGNYEIPSIQKVYWSDNYNRPRVLNIADPNTMALNIELLDLNPNILKGVSTLYEVLDSGNIKTGIYQVSARLANTAGVSGLFLTPSNPITVINEVEYTSPEKYEARDTGILVSKSISGKFFNIDTQYDRIEPVIMYRENANAVPDIFILPGQPIPGNGEFSFKYTGSETVVPISLEEFLETKIIFDTVKTVATKNNILFFGNVKYADFDVDFDARAYRFTGLNATNIGATGRYCLNCPGPRIAQLKDSVGTVTNNINGASLPTTPNWGVTDTADAIQDKDMQAPNSTCNYLFQSDGITFGGEGPNIKYEFVRMYGVNDVGQSSQYRTLLDNANNNWNNLGVGLKAPYAFTTPSQKRVNYNLDAPPQTGYTEGVQASNLYPNSAGPFGSYLTKGYQRDETYRFGIVFFSKKGEPSYTHWIADIRMPKPYMPDVYSASPENRNALYFPISSVDTQAGSYAGVINTYSGLQSTPTTNPSSGEVYGNNLGIKFTVNVSSIADQISGYSIVRVKRKDSDKTVLGQGILNPVFYSGSGGLPDCCEMWFTPNTSRWRDQIATQVTNGGAGIMENEATIASPEFLFKSSPAFSSADQIDIVQVNTAYGTFDLNDGQVNCASSTSQKLYNVWERGSAPRSAQFSSTTPKQDKATPAILAETKNIPVGFSGGGWAYNTIQIGHNWGWTGDNIGNSEPCATCCNSGTSVVGHSASAPRGIGGSRLYLGSGGSPSSNVNGGLRSIGLGVGAPGFYGVTYNDQVTGTSLGNLTNVYLANYLRSNVVQYGGNSFSSRSYNEYIPTGHIQIVTSSSTVHTDMVFGGDTYITLFDYAEQLRNGCMQGIGGTSQNIYKETRNTLHIIPVECSFPIELRKNNALPAGAVDDGYTPNNRRAPNKSVTYADMPTIYGGPAPITAEFQENWEYEFDYIAENDIMKFFPAPYPRIVKNKFDVRIHRSQIKTNGEVSDSWGVFKTEDYLDLDTAQGQLNNLITHQNYLTSFQDKGVALVSVNDRALSQDISGSEIILGTGGILARYDYLSRVIGSRHQFSFTKSHDAIFWFDMNSKNVYKMTGNAPVAISVAKGMTSYFTNKLNGIIQISDNPYLDKGITSTYDFRYNEAIMTFKDSVVDNTLSVTAYYIGSSSTGEALFTLPTFPIWLISQTSVLVSVKNTSASYLATILPSVIPGVALTLSIQGNPTLNTSDIITLYGYKPSAFTVGYNDFIDAFTSFYSFTPSVYINDSVSIFSPDSSLNRIFRHDVGPHGQYYYPINSGLDPLDFTYPSKVSLLVNQFPTETKVFDNYEIVCESTDDIGTHITDDLFNRIRLYDDYQNTDFQTLPTDTLSNKVIAKRKERTWNLSNLRNRVTYTTAGVDPDIFSPTELSSPNDKAFGERMRDKYLIVDLEYDNLNNYNYVFHTFKTHFRKSAR